MVVSYRTLNIKDKHGDMPKVIIVRAIIAPVTVQGYKHLCRESEGIRQSVEQMVMLLSMVTYNKIRCRIILQRLNCGG